MTITIAGAGMAGLLAGNMLARHEPTILEEQETLPNNHSAVLRFRSSLVGDTLGIPFQRVNMIKSALPWRNPIADALAYSKKNTGIARSDRSITDGLVVDERWIAPCDLIERMAKPLRERHSIVFGHRCTFEDDGPFISTIPMPALMSALRYPKRVPFYYQNSVNIRARLTGVNAYVSLLVPDPDQPMSRISLTGDELIIECYDLDGSLEATLLSDDIVLKALELLGLDGKAVAYGGEAEEPEISIHRSRYGKILPIDEDERREFLHWATDKRNVFSLGRFATWRPGLLLDDLVKDVRLIEGWISKASNRYDTQKHR